jgi:hypothetical protein
LPIVRSTSKYSYTRPYKTEPFLIFHKGRTIKRTLPLAIGKKTLPTHIIFSVKATPLREGVALSEVSSNVSIADLMEVEDLAEERDDETRTFEQHAARREQTQATSKSKTITTTTTTQG